MLVVQEVIDVYNLNFVLLLLLLLFEVVLDWRVLQVVHRHVCFKTIFGVAIFILVKFVFTRAALIIYFDLLNIFFHCWLFIILIIITFVIGAYSWFTKILRVNAQQRISYSLACVLQFWLMLLPTSIYFLAWTFFIKLIYFNLIRLWLHIEWRRSNIKSCIWLPYFKCTYHSFAAILMCIKRGWWVWCFRNYHLLTLMLYLWVFLCSD